mmetsp:Transcript_5489/g.12075  ORF Transcript_5489/g.12075 Transcript_5489/m.12075 type:complete len:261 (-) Transcript_5489:283-1065(-)
MTTKGRAPNGSRSSRHTPRQLPACSEFGNPPRAPCCTPPSASGFPYRRQWSTHPRCQSATWHLQAVLYQSCPRRRHWAAESGPHHRTLAASRTPSCNQAWGTPSASGTSSRRLAQGTRSCTSKRRCTRIGTGASRIECCTWASGNPGSCAPRRCLSGRTFGTGERHTAPCTRSNAPRPAWGIASGTGAGGTWARNPARRLAACSSMCSAARSCCAGHQAPAGRACPGAAPGHARWPLPRPQKRQPSTLWHLPGRSRAPLP